MRTIHDLREVFDDWERDVDARLADAGRTGTSRVASRPPAHRQRWRIAAPLLSAAAVAGTIAGVVTLTGTSPDSHSGLPPAGPTYDASPVVPTDRVGAGQYAYTATTAETVHANGRTTQIERDETWVAPDGSTWTLARTGRKQSCEIFPFSGRASFAGPTAAFIADLPTSTTAALQSYLAEHVSGSTSQQEAIFVAVGDLLRAADGLTSSALRAAFVEVLSRTDGVQVDPTARDHDGRSAIRATFIDPRRRPGSADSLYFAPGTYHLLEESSVAIGDAPSPAADSPSVAYSLPPSSTAPVAVDGGPGSVDLVTSRRVVDSLPARVTGPSCRKESS